MPPLTPQLKRYTTIQVRPGIAPARSQTKYIWPASLNILYSSNRSERGYPMLLRSLPSCYIRAMKLLSRHSSLAAHHQTSPCFKFSKEAHSQANKPSESGPEWRIKEGRHGSLKNCRHRALRRRLTAWVSCRWLVVICRELASRNMMLCNKVCFCKARWTAEHDALS